MRSLIFSASASVVLLGACRTWTATPVGTTAAPVQVASFEYPAAETRANGWQSQNDSARGRRVAADDAGYLVALDRFKKATAQYQPLRVVVYYNSALAPLINTVRRPAKGVLEMEYEEKGVKGTSSGKQTVRLYADDDATPTAGVGTQGVDAVIAQQLESAIIGHLVEGNARVLDKGLLYRKAALKSPTTYADAELRSLSADVDLLLEVTFLPRPTAPDGFEIGVRAIRTKDAAIVAQVSSAELEHRTMSMAQFTALEGGFASKNVTKVVSLRDMCHTVMQHAMTQIAGRL